MEFFKVFALVILSHLVCILNSSYIFARIEPLYRYSTTSLDVHVGR